MFRAYITTRFLPRRSDSERPAVPPFRGQGANACHWGSLPRVGKGPGLWNSRDEIRASRVPGQSWGQRRGKTQEEFPAESLEGLRGGAASLPVCAWSDLTRVLTWGQVLTGVAPCPGP